MWWWAQTHLFNRLKVYSIERGPAEEISIQQNSIDINLIGKGEK